MQNKGVWPNASVFNSAVLEVLLVALAVCGGGESLEAALSLTTESLDSVVSILVAIAFIFSRKAFVADSTLEPLLMLPLALGRRAW